MNQQNNIDDLFKNSAQQFSAPAPKKSWAKIDGVLKRKRKVVLFRKVAIAASIVVVGMLVLFVNFDDNNSLIAENNSNTVETTIINNIDSDGIINNEVVSNNITEIKKIDNRANNKGIYNNQKITIESNDAIVEIEDADKPLGNTKAGDNYEVEIIVSNISAKNINSDLATIGVKAKDSLAVKINKNVEIEESAVDNIIAINEVLNNENTVELAGNTDKDNSTEKETEVNATESTLEIGEGEANSSENKEEESRQSTENNIEEVIENEVIVPKTIIENITNNEESRFRNREELIINARKNDINFIVGQTYGASITNGIGKTPEIEDPYLSQAGETSASVWYSAAVNIDMIINNWVIKAGVRKYNFSVQGDFKVNQKDPWSVDLDQYAYSELGYIQILNINSNLRTSQPSSVVYVQDFNTYNIKVRYIDIPLSIGYKIRAKKFSVVPHIGVNYTFAYSNEVQLQSEDDYYMFGEVKDLKRHMLGVNSGLGAYYDISEHWMVGVNAEMVYYPSSVSTDETFSYKPYSLLVGPNISFKF